jgi:putative pre-16S rRNA nuclease
LSGNIYFTNLEISFRARLAKREGRLFPMRRWAPLDPVAFVDTLRERFLYFSLMRVLAIDLGSKNLGIAVSDALGLTVRPLETIRRSSDEKDIARLKFLVEDLEAEAVVVGLPLRMDGTIGDAAAAAMRFAEKLRARVGVAVTTQDERLTSYEAEQMMAERGFSRTKRRARSDEFAAMIILRDYLAATKTEEPAST